MKTTIKILAICLLMFGMFYVVSIMDMFEEVIQARISLIILASSMIATAYILKSDNYINFFSTLNETDFASIEDKKDFLNLFFSNTLRIFVMVIMIEAVLIFIPMFSNSYMLDIVTIVCAFINFVYMYYKLSMEFTK